MYIISIHPTRKDLFRKVKVITFPDNTTETDVKTGEVITGMGQNFISLSPPTDS